MKYPNFREKKKLWRKGYKRVVGLDEAGRGPLAGPVVAAAVMIKNNGRKINKKFITLGVRDSKKITPKKREELYRILIKDSQIEWGAGRVSAKVIDRINILEATKLAMKRAVESLEKKLNKKADFLILDGRIKLNLDVSQKSIIKADNKVFSCAAASIIAKVKRDRLMKRYDKKYPQYGFISHKGYGTRKHMAALTGLGPCKIHRKSFKPVMRCS
jgi:ribonuclease HII